MSKPRKPRNNETRNNNGKPHTNRKNGPRDTKEYEKAGYAEGIKKEEEKGDQNNRVSMYFSESDKALLDQASSFSMTQFLESDATPFAEEPLSPLTVPSIMTLYFNPSCGFTRGVSPSDSGINIAGQKIYNKSSSMNAKTTQYLPLDDSTLMLALGDVLGRFAYIRRCFHVAFMYNKRNWNVPRTLLEEMGVNVDDFFQNLAGYRLELNAIINMVNQISFPGDIEYFNKCIEMYSHVYKDGESPMAQLYLFVPATFWKIDESSYEGGTILKTVPGRLNLDGTRRGTMTMGAMLVELKEQIQAILASSTFNYIYADVLRMVDPDKLLNMPYIVEGEYIEPEYDPMILLQINNSVALGMPNGALGENTTPANDVYPVVDNLALKYAPQFVSGANLDVRRVAILNFPHSEGGPDVTQRVEVTRMVSTIISSDGITQDAALADHYLVSFTIKGQSLGATTPFYTMVDDASATAEYLKIFALALEKFDYAPRFFIYKMDAESNMTLQYVSGDLDFFTSISHAYLKKVNDLIYAHLFEIPSIVNK